VACLVYLIPSHNDIALLQCTTSPCNLVGSLFDVDRFDQLIINFDIYGKRRSVFGQSKFKIGFNFKWFSLVSYDVLPELL